MGSGVCVQVFQKVCSYNFLGIWLNNLNTMPFYAVAKGRTTGIFKTWPECEAQVKGFPGAKYKKFDSEESAQGFVGCSTLASPSYSKASYIRSGHKTNYNATNSGMKRPYSTKSSSNQRDGMSRNNKIESNHEDSFDSFESEEGLEIIIKQLDDIEAKATRDLKGSKPSKRTTILIDPPETKRSRISSNQYEEDDEGYVQVYTDGACSANGRSGARAGIGVYWGEGHSHNVSEPVSGRATNNCGEIQAATRAVQQAIQNGIKKLTINTDSLFVINSVTKWMPGNFISCFYMCPTVYYLH